MMIDFLAVKCLSAFNRVIGRPLLKALKAVMLIHCLIVKFPIEKGIGQVRGRHHDSRECYCKSLELAEVEPRQPQAMEVEKISRGLMETNIEPLPTRR